MSTITPARRRAYRSRHKKQLGWNGKFIIVVIIIAFLLFIAAIMLGNYLGGLAESTQPVSSAPPETTGTRGTFSVPDTPVIIARAYDFAALSAETAADTTSAPAVTAADTADTGAATSEQTGNTEKVSYSALSVLLREKTADGTVSHYTSSVSTGYSSGTWDGPTLDEGMARIRGTYGKTYLSGVFAVTYPEAPADMSALIREYELTLIGEIFSAGFDDVILYGFSSSPAGLREAAAFINELHARTGGCAGLALDFSFFSSSGAQDRLAQFDLSGGFFALDLWNAEVPGLMSGDDLVFDRVQRCASLISVYNIRVLLGCGVSPDPDGQVTAAMSAGAYNLQVVGSGKN